MKSLHWANATNIKWRHMTSLGINPDIEQINKLNFLNKLDKLHMAVIVYTHHCQDLSMHQSYIKSSEKPLHVPNTIR